MSIFDTIKTIPQDQRGELLGWLFDRQMRIERRIFSLSCEITPVCNFKCKMCYVRKEAVELKREGGLLPAELWVSYFKQAMAIGGLYRISLTGGECLTHPDFFKIYDAAYDMGLQIIVMTNASLISNEVIDHFTHRPPELIDITLYGFSEETYQQTCENGEAFSAVINAVKALKAAHLNVRIKSTLTRSMMHDFSSIKRFAEEMDIPFVYNNTLKANRTCTMEDVECNEVSYDETLLLASEAYNDECEAKEIQIPHDYQVKYAGIDCAAGRNTCHINWRGEMTPCVTLDTIKVKLTEDNLVNAWRMIVDWADHVPAIVECQTCKYYYRCKHCIALHYGDIHEFGKPSPRLCYKIQHNIKD